MAASTASSASAAADERLPVLPEAVTPLKRFVEYGQFLEKHTRAVVLFVITEDPPSVQQLDVVDSFSKDFPDVGFAAASARGDIAHFSGVTAAPVTVFYEDGYPIGQQQGADPALSFEALLTWRNCGAEEVSKFLRNQQPSANERAVLQTLEKGCLKGLVSRRPLMVFMKGNPTQPVCRFSKQLMQLFSDYHIQHFGFVDILQDNHLRETLKLFSDWPTYPQVYSEGEFVGGVDILRDLAESGQLRSSLTPSAFVAEEAAAVPAAATTTTVLS